MTLYLICSFMNAVSNKHKPGTFVKSVIVYPFNSLQNSTCKKPWKKWNHNITFTNSMLTINIFLISSVASKLHWTYPICVSSYATIRLEVRLHVVSFYNLNFKGFLQRLVCTQLLLWQCSEPADSCIMTTYWWFREQE